MKIYTVKYLVGTTFFYLIPGGHKLRFIYWEICARFKSINSVTIILNSTVHLNSVIGMCFCSATIRLFSQM